MTAVRKITKVAWSILTGIIAALIGTVTFILAKRMMAKKLQAPVPMATSFDSRDVVRFEPVPQKVFETTSDMTANAILEGGFGAAVVMVYAEWCVHCRNMMPAFEAAAAKSNIPFVRIQGQTAPVTSSKHKIFGYPTVLGVRTNGEVVRFNESRTEDNLLKFAAELGGTDTTNTMNTAPVVIAVAPEIIPSEPLNK